MQHVFSVGGNSITFRASPFVSYHHPAMEQPAPDPAPKEPTPPPPQQKLLIKLRVSDLGTAAGSSKPKQNGTSDEDDERDEAPAKRRGGGPGSRGKRRKVEQPATPTSDDACDSSASATPTKRGRGGKGSRGGGTGRGRGGRKSGLQHQVLPVPIPGTPDSAAELSLRPASPSSESTSNVALTPTPISTPTIPIPVPNLPAVAAPAAQPSTPSEIDPALLATAPRRPLPTRAFPVQPAPKTTAATPTVGNGGIDWNKRRVRRWGVKMREIRGVGGGSWWVRTWVGSPESEYASDPTRILSVPTTLPRSSSTTSLTTVKQRKPKNTNTVLPKPEPRSATQLEEVKIEPTSHYRDQEGVELLTAFASSGGIGANHYREREYSQRGESSGASTPSVPVPKVKYDLARDGIEEVAAPPALAPISIPVLVAAPLPEAKGKGKEVLVNGSSKGKEKAVENGPVVGDARVRSGSGYEQAAKDVEMELMGDT
ncbi:hypothetical protein RhiLY_08045 [Ceratobasidium sp. AG-Ba]|nr:hypothetical protein RhiLY_08045 [Ceratobasidium sp. AG-Ba]